MVILAVIIFFMQTAIFYSAFLADWEFNNYPIEAGPLLSYNMFLTPPAEGKSYTTFQFNFEIYVYLSTSKQKSFQEIFALKTTFENEAFYQNGFDILNKDLGSLAGQRERLNFCREKLAESKEYFKLAKDSPALNTAQRLPNDWPDSQEEVSEGAPDYGAIEN